MTSQNTPWWQGTRGEWYFVVQVVLLALLLLAALVPGQPAWPPVVAWAARGLGLLLGLAGGALGLAVVLLLFFEVKSRREERQLLARFPAYADYRRRVRKFFPYLY